MILKPLPGAVCVDTGPHTYVHLRTEKKEVRWHVWANVDTFYCSKCLVQKTVETEIRKEPRW